MTAPDNGTIRKFKSRIGSDGKPIPIYHWINRTFAKDALAFELTRAKSKEFKGYEDEQKDFDEESGERPNPHYVQVSEGSQSVTLGKWFEPEESSFGGTEEEKEIVQYMRSEWARQADKGKTPFGSAFTRLAMCTLILEAGGKPNGAEIARRLNAGTYPLPYRRYPKLKDYVPEPCPISIDERTVQRLIADYVDGLRKIREKHARLRLEKKQQQLATRGLPLC
jgi:hypothetical protein